MNKPSQAANARVCACVLMNHPFPANLPLLRRIYRERFSEVRFLIPFERMVDEPDVITVYHGSYNHAAYLTDAYRDLAALDCDYYLVVHDDVLLNPRISDQTFRSIFPLGLHDGFIPRVGPLHSEIQQWLWAAGFFPKILYPKSMLFGGGVEASNLRRYLPDPDVVRRKMREFGFSGTERVKINAGAITNETMPEPSRLLLHGLSAPLPSSAPAQAQIETIASEAFRSTVEAMRQDARSRGKLIADDWVDLPLPLAMSGYVTDFYILPKSALDDFCHYIGVASSANLFVEIMVPTLMFACCDHVKAETDFNLDFSGFDVTRHLNWFLSARSVAIHPFKLSLLKAEAQQQHFIEVLHSVREGRSVPSTSPLSRTTFGRWHGGYTGHADGWHEGEDWGVWSAAREAIIPVTMSRAGSVRVILTAPVSPHFQEFSGCLKIGSERVIPLILSSEQRILEVVISDLVPDADGYARIHLISNLLIRPCDIDTTSDDCRPLGFGLIRVESLESSGH